MTVTFASGYIAGIFCAVVSHPADTMVSKINAKKMEGGFFANAGVIYKEIGFSGLWSGYAKINIIFSDWLPVSSW